MRLAVFDIDGTLTDTMKSDLEFYIRAFAESAGVQGINTNWADYRHVTDRGIAREILEQHNGHAPGDEEIASVLGAFSESLGRAAQADPGLIRPVPGAPEAFARLRREPDWSVAIATGSWKASALLKLRYAGIEVDGVAAAFSNDDLTREGIVRHAIERAQASRGGGVRFSSVTYIGDAIWDVATSRNLGIGFVGIGSAEARELLMRAGATQAVQDFKNYAAFVRALETAAVPETR